LDKVIPLEALDTLYIGGSCWTYAYRRHFLLCNKLFFPPLSVGEDFIFVLSVFLRLDRIMWIGKTFYHYRIGRSDSAMAKSRQENKEQKSVITKTYLLCRALLDYAKNELLTSDHNTVIVMRRIIHELGWYAEKDSYSREFLTAEYKSESSFIRNVLNDSVYALSNEARRLMSCLLVEPKK
jgi:hypothetical protein